MQEEINDAINDVHVQMTSELEWTPYDPQAKADELLIRESLHEPHSYSCISSMQIAAVSLGDKQPVI